MSETKRSFLVMLRNGDERARALGVEIAAWLQERGATATLCEHRVGDGLSACPEPAGAPWDVVLVLGGDGTFIGVARICLHLDIPLLGLNLGRVGFLAEGAAEWPRRLAVLLEGRQRVSRRLALSFGVQRGGVEVFSGVAVNDVVASRGDMARLIRLGVARGGEDIGSLRADGVIVSTPTGSTAYGYSAGGPLVHPEMQALCLTPVCPFLNSFGAMVLPPDEPLVVRVEERRGEVRLTVDGQRPFSLEHGDLVRVTRSPHQLLVAQTGASSYFSVLANKGFFTQR